jgi:hypothetical protein
MNDFQGMAKFLTEPSVFLYLFHPEHRHLLVQWVLLPGVVPFFVSKLLQKARKSENAGNVGFVRNAGEFLLELQFVKEGHQILAPFASLHRSLCFNCALPMRSSLSEAEAAIAFIKNCQVNFKERLTFMNYTTIKGTHLPGIDSRQKRGRHLTKHLSLRSRINFRLTEIGRLKNLAELANEADNLQERDLWLHRSESLVKRHFPRNTVLL